MTERKWQMTRVRAGDYLLPSNSGKSLWRFYRYTEDGSAEITGEFWNCWRYSHRGQDLPHGLGEQEDLLDWERWVLCATVLETRQKAIDYALECAERRGI